MLQKIFAENNCVSVYGEAHPKAMVDYRLKDKPAIQKMLKHDANRIVVVKPINDMQYSDRLLDYWNDTRAIWVFRHYLDTITSAVRKWGPAQKKIVGWIMDKEEIILTESEARDKDFSTYMERMSRDTFTMIKNLAYENMSPEDGAALMWFMRNAILFDLNLQADRRVLLISYEDIVTDPQRNVKTVFDFLDCPIHEKYWEGIYASSVRKHRPPVLAPPIAEACENMFRKLEAESTNQSQVKNTRRASS